LHPHESIPVCVACGKEVPPWFLFFHMAGHEEEGIVIRRGRRKADRASRERLSEARGWDLVAWVRDLPAPPY
jgi:hypothetical protein